jgi:uncharacterized protein involved in response to NO
MTGFKNLRSTLGDEALRPFFPLAALHAALWPLLWTVAYGLSLPLAAAISPGTWHAGEMVLGTYGAALLGFILTAVPEWTDTARLRGAPLFALAALWGLGRCAGFLGADDPAWPVLFADAAWLLFLPAYVAVISRRKRTDRHLAFVGWLAALAAAGIAGRLAAALGDDAAAREAFRLAGLIFLGLLGLALSRIAAPVTNRVLDPGLTTTPYRPHPGRRNLAPGLVALVVLGELAGLSPGVSGWLLIAAGAAFLDRVGESFVGAELRRAEMLALAGSPLLSGAGLLLAGAARLGAPWGEAAALHLALMGGLGTGVLAVFAVAGLMHTGRDLPVPRATAWALGAAFGATLLRALPDMGLISEPPGPAYGLAAALWAAAFLVWLQAYWPMLSAPKLKSEEGC